MAEPLKNSFGPEIPPRIGDMVARVYPDFDREAFLASALDGYCELELTPKARPRVFKGTETTIAPGERVTVRKTVSVTQHSTRTHYPGTHKIEIMLNGGPHPGAEFEIV